LFAAEPWQQSRDAARYMHDCFLHYGSEAVEPTGKERRWRLFDLPFAATGSQADAQAQALVGHAAVQEEIFSMLQNFVQEGYCNRLLLLHGPNGSAKSTLAACLMQALEHYSHQEEGALYQFSWVFPRGTERKEIGFSVTEMPEAPGGSYAHLPDERIEVKVNSRLREHPLLLVPLSDRRRLLSQAYDAAQVAQRPPAFLEDGELGQKNRSIFEALLTKYAGDLTRVWSHVRVERYHISRRYRVGAVTVGPEMAVDGSERQITADHTLQALPASLSALTLYEPHGALVDACGGVVEYSDLLKRPLDAWKYLLLAIEDAQVALPMSQLTVNALWLASSNELHLNAFREHHEYHSFRGRLHLVRVPYLLDHRLEQAIYDRQVAGQLRQHVAPDATWVAALWAVLTRLKAAQVEHYDSPAFGRLVTSLTPMEKAMLYAGEGAPSRCSEAESRELQAGVAALQQEWEGATEYEGLTGASARELRALLLEAAHDSRFDYLSPVAVLDAIALFCERQDFAFLRQTPERGYGDHRDFVIQVRRLWLDRVDEALRICSGLVAEERYTELFGRYIMHVSAWLKKERIYNPLTCRDEDPDESLMRSTEALLDHGDDAAEFRRTLMRTVAAHVIDHPDAGIDAQRLFPQHIAKLQQSDFAQRRKVLAALATDVIQSVRDVSVLTPEGQEAAKRCLASMQTRFHYTAQSAADALAELLNARYRDLLTTATA
ncbi:MAG: serine protein kinase PrkA, partial [Polyangiales bacterium]